LTPRSHATQAPTRLLEPLLVCCALAVLVPQTVLAAPAGQVERKSVPSGLTASLNVGIRRVATTTLDSALRGYYGSGLGVAFDARLEVGYPLFDWLIVGAELSYLHGGIGLGYNVEAPGFGELTINGWELGAVTRAVLSGLHVYGGLELALGPQLVFAKLGDRDAQTHALLFLRPAVVLGIRPGPWRRYRRGRFPLFFEIRGGYTFTMLADTYTPTFDGWNINFGIRAFFSDLGL
jgi:hypothetical protein